MKRYNVAIVGASGLIGHKFVEILEEREFPVSKLFLFASEKSAGKKIIFREKEYYIQELDIDSFKKNKIDFALFSAGAKVSQKFAPIASCSHCVVIDNSSAWRMNKSVPLVVPEINPKDAFKHKNIISNPNCSTIQAALVLKPLHDAYKIKRVVMSTYQAVSGAGNLGIEDLESKDNTPKKFRYPIYNNCIPQIDVFNENGYTKEEIKLMNEIQKIFNDSIKVTATAVRVPIKNCHSESINIEFEKPFDIGNIIALLEKAPGVKIIDNINQERYPMPIIADGKDEVFVGRIRRDFTVDNGLNLWVVADNIRKGAATNAVQIAELLIGQTSKTSKNTDNKDKSKEKINLSKIKKDEKKDDKKDNKVQKSKKDTKDKEKKNNEDNKNKSDAKKNSKKDTKRYEDKREENKKTTKIKQQKTRKQENKKK